MTFGSGVSIKVAVIKDTICNIYSSAINDNIFRSLSYFIRDLNGCYIISFYPWIIKEISIAVL